MACVYIAGNNVLINGDCRDPEVMKTLRKFAAAFCGSAVAQLCLTDPPYGVNLGGSQKAAERRPWSVFLQHKIANDDLTGGGINRLFN